MKIRNGFVSNSSSSSYVIAYRQSEPCPHCGRNDIDIMSIIEQSEDNGDGETSVAAVGYDAVMEHLKDWFDADDEIFEKIKELNDGTYNFGMVYISYSDTSLSGMLENNKSIKILHSGG